MSFTLIFKVLFMDIYSFGYNSKTVAQENHEKRLYQQLPNKIICIHQIDDFN